MPRISMSEKLNNASKLAAIDTTGYKEMYLDADKITPSEENFYPLDEIQELADDMRERGQLQPMLIGRVDGKDMLAVGHRRRAAILLNNSRGHIQKAWCFAKEMDQIEFMLTLISANAYTRKMDDATLLEQAKKLNYWTQKAAEAGKIKITGRKRDFVAEKLQVSSTKMAQINQINAHLSDEGKQALKDGDINFSKAYETSRLPKEEQGAVIKNDGLLSNDVRAMVQERKVPKVSYEEVTVDEEKKSEQIVDVEFNIPNQVISQSNLDTEKELDFSDETLQLLSVEIKKYEGYSAKANGVQKMKYEIISRALNHYMKYLEAEKQIRA